MSAFTDAWAELYAIQTEATGTAIVCTVTGYATSKAAIPSSDMLDAILVDGGTADTGQRTIQMLASEFSTDPPEDTAVAIGSRSYVLLKFERNNGIAYLTVGDRAANE